MSRRLTGSERVAAELTDVILSGELLPGERLGEERFSDRLGVSRNTLREGFRLLVADGLLEGSFGKGMEVCRPTEADVRDLYWMRIVIETNAIREANRSATAPLFAAVERGQLAWRESDWAGVATADLEFHRAVTALSGSARATQVMGRILAETRLIFHTMPTPRSFHDFYLKENRRIAQRVRRGALDEAAALLTSYLRRAEAEILATYSTRAFEAGRSIPVVNGDGSRALSSG